MTTKHCLFVLLATAGIQTAHAQSSFVCPQVSPTSTFGSTQLQTDCGAETSGCTTKAGVNWDPTNNVLTLPGSAGNFQSPPNRAVNGKVYFAAPADYDGDGWADVVSADNTDKVIVMRNQTITCGTTGCSGNATTAPSVQTIPASWWNTLSNKRDIALRPTTTTGGSALALKPSLSSGTQRNTPLAAGDFDGDGWPDFIQISAVNCPSGCSGNDVKTWPTAARLFLNTKNCHLASELTNPKPCGIGMLCDGQPANGACSVSAGKPAVTNGVKYTETQLSCTNNSRCPYYMPTFATYDLLSGAAESDTVNTSTATTTTPGNFGPVGHPVQNIVVLDWDGDGDLDFLYGRSPGTCPSGLCGTGFSTFYAGIDVWLNSCRQSAQWNPATKSCPGHIPRFSHAANSGCTAATCGNADTLIPSTAHNTTTLRPDWNLGFDVSADGDKRIPGFAYTDIDLDGDYDLVIGSPGCCSDSDNAANYLRIFRGTTNNKYTHVLDTANPISLSHNTGTSAWAGFKGQLTAVFVTDFSGDGYPDIITGSDGFAYDSSGLGGRTQYWKHTGNNLKPYGNNWPGCGTVNATCNPGHTTLISETGGSGGATANLAASPPTFGDFDMGLMLDYDHDPNRTLDMVMTNGNLVDEFYVFPNRASPATVAACGTVSSGTIEEPADESTVSGACITPTATFPNATSSITYYLTNEDPENYISACTQTSSGFTPATCCVTFPNITGKTIRWKAVMDSNTTDGPGVCTSIGTASPGLSNVNATYTYSLAAQHYRAGVVVTDGAVYAGSFFQPGNRGAFYALKAGGTTSDLPYYNAATKIDQQAEGGLSSYPRNLYTASGVGTGISTIALSAATTSQFGASSPTTANQVRTWLNSRRFGLGSNTTRLGAVMDSTPAILSPPFLPSYYSYLPGSEKSLYDAFSSSNTNRLPLALFASMDGAIHAIRSKATTLNDVSAIYNGTEAWAFVPPYVALSMGADYMASTSSGNLVVRSYPDGSPSLLDYRKADGTTIRTVAIVPDAAGGSSITALDVTSTVSPSDTSYATVNGPTAMWSLRPGDGLAGKAWAKPGVARVRIGSNERFVVVAGTGIDSADPSKGKIVSGYDLETGVLLWKFEAACPITSDITIAETDDVGEPGGPSVDGYADRAFFADNCGYVYKVNPGQDLSGGWMTNTTYGPIALGTSNGVARFALFSTAQASAFGGTEQRPIAGGIAAKIDSSGDLILYFGTGGLETFDASKQNKFFAVRAKDGTVRSSVTGSCTGSGASAKCDKFYGGVVVADTNVIVQRTRDAVISGTANGTCDLGTTAIEFLDSNTFTLTQSLTTIDGQPIAATSGPLYGDAGALYFATVDGSINRIGTPRAATAGADTASGNMNHFSAGGSTTYDTPYTLAGWRVVL